MTNEKDKMLSGALYDANYDPDLIAERKNCKVVLHEINSLSPISDEKRYELFRKILGKVKGQFIIESPFHCDYGYNIELGENFYMNVNCVILDEAKVTFGNNVFIALLSAMTILAQTLALALYLIFSCWHINRIKCDYIRLSMIKSHLVGN